MTSSKSNWLLINVLYIVSRDNLGRIGWNLWNMRIVLLMFWLKLFMCSVKFILTSHVNPWCFLDILFIKGMSLTKTQGYSSLLVFLLNMTFYDCLVKSGLKVIFHWKNKLLITVRSWCKVVAHDWMSFTPEKRDISSAKSVDVN